MVKHTLKKGGQLWSQRHQAKAFHQPRFPRNSCQLKKKIQSIFAGRQISETQDSSSTQWYYPCMMPMLGAFPHPRPPLYKDLRPITRTIIPLHPVIQGTSNLKGVAATKGDDQDLSHKLQIYRVAIYLVEPSYYLKLL